MHSFKILGWEYTSLGISNEIELIIDRGMSKFHTTFLKELSILKVKVKFTCNA